MPRRSSGGRSSRPTPHPASTKSSPPRPVHQEPKPAPVHSTSGGSMSGGFGSAVAEGFAFGGGSAIAHRAIDAIMGPRTIHMETTAAPSSASPPTTMAAGSDACSLPATAFQDCLNSNTSDISKCQFYMDMLVQCKNSSSASASLH